MIARVHTVIDGRPIRSNVDGKRLGRVVTGRQGMPGSGSGASVAAPYFTQSPDPTLTGEWALVAGSGITFSDNTGTKERTVSSAAAPAPDFDAQSIAFMALIENET